MRKTIRKRKFGGKSLGKGAHGEAFNVGNNQAAPTFFSNITKKPISKIVIYSPDGEQIHESEQDITQFCEFIRIVRGFIAKVFLPVNTIEADFLEEVNVNRKIINIYGSRATDFLTMSPTQPVFKNEMVACKITFKDGELIYAVFNKRCNNKYTITDLKQFANDILDSIIVLQEQSYEHNDIKMDNIVLCDNRYKLIDWGQSSTVLNPEKKSGSLLSTSPIRWYVLGKSHIDAKYRMQFRTSMRNSRFAFSKLFRDVFYRIVDEYNTVTADTPDRDELHAKYLYSFDVFMLGVTMLHAVHKYNLDAAKYLPIINKFTSLLEPVKNAIEAKRLLSGSSADF